MRQKRELDGILQYPNRDPWNVEIGQGNNDEYHLLLIINPLRSLTR